MSLIPIGISIAEAALLNLISPILLRSRSIAGIIANVTIEEQHVDELTVTEHPVEQGAAIADHAYKRPVAVTIQAGWSNSSPQALGNPNYVQQIYGQFIALQASRIPFDIITGKRVYKNMLIQRLMQTTSRDTENAMIMTLECREVILVSTQTVTLPDASVQSSPQTTAPTLNTGSKSLGPAPNFHEG